MNPTKLAAIITMVLGAVAIFLPFYVGTLAVMLLGAVVLASGVIALIYANALRKQGFLVSLIGPLARVIAGAVLLIWPELTLWVVAVVLGAGLVLSGVSGLSALRDTDVVNPPVYLKIEHWLSIVFGVLLIVSGSSGSAVLVGAVLGIALIMAGIQQWRMAGYER